MLDRRHLLVPIVLASGVALAPSSHAQSNPNCHPSYVNACIPPPPPDLDCGDLDDCDIQVVGADPHHLDRDRDGIACECR